MFDNRPETSGTSGACLFAVAQRWIRVPALGRSVAADSDPNQEVLGMHKIKWVLGGLLLLGPIALVGCDNRPEDTPRVQDERLDRTGAGEEIEDTAD